jgi:hypothetical protein
MTGIDYSEKIPNNVDLASDKRLQRALEAWQPSYIEWWNSMGPTDFNKNEILPAHRDRRRQGRLGALRPREDARLPLGHLPRAAADAAARSASATTWARTPGSRCRVNTATGCVD